MSGQVTDALGVPGVGLHAHRTLGLATVDVVATLAVALTVAAAWSFRRPSVMKFARAAAISTIALFAAGVIAHVVFRVPTALNKALCLA